MAKRPRISVTERSLQSAAVLDSDPRYRKGIDSPFGVSSDKIQLKEPGWYCRWFNNAVMADHVWRNKNIGYDNVRPEELVDTEQIGALQVDAAGSIVRGERGQEVLLKIPDPVYKARQLAKARKNMADMRDFDKQKQEMLNATAAQYGGEAADYVNSHIGPVGRVQTSYERIEVNESEES